VQYQPLAALSAVASGSSISLFVPGAGTIVVAPGNTPQRGTAMRGKPAFATITKPVSTDGVVTLAPKLSKKLKKKLKRGKKVKLRFTVTYRSPDGTTASKVGKVTLQKPKKGKASLPHPVTHRRALRTVD